MPSVELRGHGRRPRLEAEAEQAPRLVGHGCLRGRGRRCDGRQTAEKGDGVGGDALDLAEPPLYVVLVGIAFRLVLAPGIVADLEEGE